MTYLFPIPLFFHFSQKVQPILSEQRTLDIKMFAKTISEERTAGKNGKVQIRLLGGIAFYIPFSNIKNDMIPSIGQCIRKNDKLKFINTGRKRRQILRIIIIRPCQSQLPTKISAWPPSLSCTLLFQNQYKTYHRDLNQSKHTTAEARWDRHPYL